MHYSNIVDGSNRAPGAAWLPKLRLDEIAAATPHAGSVETQSPSMSLDHFKDLLNAVVEAVTPIPGALEAISKRMVIHEYRRI